MGQLAHAKENWIGLERMDQFKKLHLHVVYFPYFGKAAIIHTLYQIPSV